MEYYVIKNTTSNVYKIPNWMSWTKYRAGAKKYKNERTAQRELEKCQNLGVNNLAIEKVEIEIENGNESKYESQTRKKEIKINEITENQETIEELKRIIEQQKARIVELELELDI